MTTTSELTAFISDPIVKIKADILAAEHYQAQGMTDLLNVALSRIAGRMSLLYEPYLTEVIQRLVDADLVEDPFTGRWGQ